MLNIAIRAAGIAVSAGLIYFGYSVGKKSGRRSLQNSYSEVIASGNSVIQALDCIQSDPEGFKAFLDTSLTTVKAETLAKHPSLIGNKTAEKKLEEFYNASRNFLQTCADLHQKKKIKLKEYALEFTQKFLDVMKNIPEGDIKTKNKTAKYVVEAQIKLFNEEAKALQA